MNKIKAEFSLNEKGNLLGCTSWPLEVKNALAQRLNQHGFLDQYDSREMLQFLGGKEHLEEVLEFKKTLEKVGKSTLSLDIDETLSATSTYWFACLLELFGNPEELTPEQMVRKYYHTQNVSYWKEHQGVQSWMHEHREDDELQKKIMLIDGVVEAYQKIHQEIIPISSYITARPDSVKNGTLSRLQQHNFPNHTRLILRPQGLDHSLSNLWKACVLDILYPNVVGIVDDNPNLVKLLPQRYKGHIFLYDKAHTEYNHINVYVCETINDVSRNVRQIFS